MRYFPNGHLKEEYAVLPRRLLEDGERFRKLVEENIRYVCVADEVSTGPSAIGPV